MSHPYHNLPTRQFWRSAVADVPWRDVDFVKPGRLVIGAGSKLVTAGSCFARHIATGLQDAGFAIHVVENPHPLLPRTIANEMNYGCFSARFGNIYTVRHLLELFDQAFGHRPIIEDFVCQDGAYFDMLRPAIQSCGFSSLTEARADRHYHISCVKKMFESADVFIFTLGLTEAWTNNVGRYVYPSCPGTIAGEHDSSRHEFHNFTFAEVLADLMSVLTRLNAINDRVNTVLTVSPVSMVATYENENVIVATCYSKSILRAACGEMARSLDRVNYFPSFEIISSACSRGQYLDSDGRQVTQQGIDHVMTCFRKAFSTGDFGETNREDKTASHIDYEALSHQLATAECDELFNDPAFSGLNRN